MTVYYSFFMGHICTANKDGTIPLNARDVCFPGTNLTQAQTQHITHILHRANTQPDFLGVVKDYLLDLDNGLGPSPDRLRDAIADAENCA